MSADNSRRKIKISNWTMCLSNHKACFSLTKPKLLTFSGKCIVGLIVITIFKEDKKESLVNKYYAAVENGSEKCIKSF